MSPTKSILVSLMIILCLLGETRAAGPSFASVDAILTNNLNIFGDKVSYIIANAAGKVLQKSHLGTSPYTDTTQLHIASGCKWPAMATIMKVVEDGYLSLDDPISKFYINNEFDASVSAMTIAQMMSHQSGYMLADPWIFALDVTLQQSVLGIAGGGSILGVQTPNSTSYFTPGTQVGYSDIGMQIAGAIAERATGRSFNDLYRMNIADPLGMNSNSKFVSFDGIDGLNVAIADGLKIGITDYATFLQALLNWGQIYVDDATAGTEMAQVNTHAQATAFSILNYDSAYMLLSDWTGELIVSDIMLASGLGSPDAPTHMAFGSWITKQDDYGYPQVLQSPGIHGFQSYIDLTYQYLVILYTRTDVEYESLVDTIWLQITPKILQLVTQGCEDPEFNSGDLTAVTCVVCADMGGTASTPGCGSCNYDSGCTSCLPGYFADYSTGTLVCTVCGDADCAVCIDAATAVSSCLQCKTTKFQGTSACLACGSNCDVCDSATLCTQCSANFILKLDNTCIAKADAAACGVLASAKPYKLGLTCVATCPEAKYFTTEPDGTNSGTCTKCSEYCLTCTSATVCTLCQPEWYLLANNCVADCLSGSFVDTVTTPEVPSCTTCTSTNCGTCDSSQVCLSCKSGFYNSAAAGDAFTCVACGSNAATCSDATTALSCVTGPLIIYYLKDGACIDNCGVTTGFFLKTTVSIFTCTACTAPQCTKCARDICTDCGVGFYINVVDPLVPECTACSVANCVDCTTATACTSCTATTHYLQPSNTACATTCPSGYFTGTTPPLACEACSAGCTTCSSATVCTVCSAIGYFDDTTTTSACIACSAHCKTCLLAATSCTECHTGHYLTGSDGARTCTSRCPVGTYVGEISTKPGCVGCASGCDDCYLETTEKCRRCTSNFAIAADVCTTCLATAIIDSSACVLCNDAGKGGPNCISCTTTECLACDQKYYVALPTTLGSACALCTALIADCNICGFSNWDSKYYQQYPEVTYTTGAATLDYKYNSATVVTGISSAALPVSATKGVFVCEQCIVGKYYNRYTSLCTACSSIDANCISCQNSLWCDTCAYGYYPKLTTGTTSTYTCVPCASAPGLGGCSDCDNNLDLYLRQTFTDAVTGYAAKIATIPTTAPGSTPAEASITITLTDYNTNINECADPSSAFDYAARTCVPCPPGCRRCVSAISYSGTATLAAPGTVFTCLDCTDKNSIVSAQFQNQCLSCQDLTFQGCAKCQEINTGGVYTYTCAACGPGYAFTVDSMGMNPMCTPAYCDPICTQCVSVQNAGGDYVMQCLACPKNFLLDQTNQICVPQVNTCVKGSFWDNRYLDNAGSANTPACQVCSSVANGGIAGCNQCRYQPFQQFSRLMCTQCHSGYAVDRQSGQCIGDVTRQCDRGCLVCDILLTYKCTVCDASIHYVEITPTPTTVGCQLDCSFITSCQSCTEDIDPLTGKQLIVLCTSCLGSKILLNGVCNDVADCAADGAVYKYKNLLTGACDSCPTNCLGCFGVPQPADDGSVTWQAQCGQCAAGYMVSSNGQCNPGMELFTNLCGEGCLDASCVWSQALRKPNCATCSAGYTLTITNTPDDGSKYCKLDCPTNCDKCISAPSLTCLLCSSTFILSPTDGACYTKPAIVDGKYFSPVLDTVKVDIGGAVVAPDATNVLGDLDCPADCAKCEWNPLTQGPYCNYCTDTTHKLDNNRDCWLVADLPADAPFCPDRTWKDTANCGACPDHCILCSSATVCITCDFGYNLNLYTDLCDQDKSCMMGQYQSEDGSCQDCGIQFCASCAYDVVNQAVVCLKPVNSRYIVNSYGQILDSFCPDYQYFDSDFGCQLCPENCLACNLDVDYNLYCSKCDPAFTWTPDSVNTPPLPTCVFNTGYCTGATVASTSQFKCIACPLHCATCTITAANQQSIFRNDEFIECATCDTGYTKDTVGLHCNSDSCVIPANYWGLQVNTNLNLQFETCISCTTLQGCLTCWYDQVNKYVSCSTCDTTLYTLDTSYNRCVLTDTTTMLDCGAGQGIVFFDNPLDYSECWACSPGCSACEFDYSVYMLFCQTCTEGFKTDPSGCVVDTTAAIWGELPACVATTSYISYTASPLVAGSCIACPAQCLTCVQNLNSPTPPAQCLSCATGFELNGPFCLKKCLDNQYQSYDTTQTDLAKFTCVACVERCTVCALDLQAAIPAPKCLKCVEGFYVNKGFCKKLLLSDCSSDDTVANTYLGKTQYATFVEDYNEEPGSGSFIVQCNDCPITCLATSGCRVNDPYDPFATPSCVKCASGLVTNPKDPGQCVYKILLNPTKCEQGKYSYLKTSGAAATWAWACGDCGNCKDCDGYYGDDAKPHVASCQSCNEGFYLVTDEYGNSICKKNPTCPVGQYATVLDPITNSIGCQACEQPCEECKQKNTQDPTTYICTKCGTGFTGDNSANCIPTLAASCKTGQYGFKLADLSFRCNDCDDTCATCHGDLAHNYAQICDTCKPGSTLNTATSKCDSSCSRGTFYDIVTVGCQPCDISCLSCKGPTNTDCLDTCSEGFSKTAKGACVFVPPANLTDCGPGGYLGSQGCQCESKKQYFDELKKKCLNIKDYAPGLGNFIKGDKKLKCGLVNGKALCGVCTGPSPSQCQVCVPGYYMDNAQQQCTKCSPGCDQCSGPTQCDQCQPGFMTIDIQNGQVSTQCVAACPDATLPSLASFYMLNDFTDAQIKTARDQSPAPMDEATRLAITLPPIAHGMSFEPLFKSDSLPWSLDKNRIPIDKNTNKQVMLLCIPCLFNCKGECAPGQIWVADLQLCYPSSKCPDTKPYVLGTNAVTKKPECQTVVRRLLTTPAGLTGGNSFTITNVQTYSLDSATGLQDNTKPFIANIITNAIDPTTVTCLWSLTGINNAKVDKNGVRSITASTKETLRKAQNSVFSTPLSNQACSLNVGSSGLDSDMEYQFSVTATQTQAGVATTYTQVVAFQTATFSSTRQFSELGISNNDYFLNDNGVSKKTGEQTFTAGFTLTNNQQLKKPTGSNFQWTYSIAVDGDGGFVVGNSQDLAFQATFPVFPISSTADENINIVYSVTLGNQVWQAKRTVVLKKIAAAPAAVFDYTKAASVVRALKIPNPPTLSQTEISFLGHLIYRVWRSQAQNTAQSDLKVLTQVGYCSALSPANTNNDVKVCSGHGSCAAGTGTGKTQFKCVCTTGFSGPACELSDAIKTSLLSISTAVIAQFPTGSTLNAGQQGSIADFLNNVLSTGVIDETTFSALAQLGEDASKSLEGPNSDILTIQNLANAQQKFFNIINWMFMSRRILAATAKDLALKMDKAQSQQKRSFFKKTLNKKKGVGLNSPAPLVDDKGKTTGAGQLTSAGMTNDIALGVGTTKAIVGKTAAGAAGDDGNVHIVSKNSPLQNAAKTMGDNAVEVNIQKANGDLATPTNSGAALATLSFQVLKSAAGTATNFTCAFFDEPTSTWQTTGLKWVSTILKTPVGVAPFYEVTCTTSHFSTFNVATGQYTAPTTPTTTTPTTGGGTGGGSTTSSSSFLLISLQLLAALLIILF